MAPKHHPTPLSGGDRKALTKELGKARTMTRILAAQSAEMRAKAESVFRRGVSTTIGNGVTSPQFNEINGLEGSR